MNDNATLQAIKNIRHSTDISPKNTEFLYDCLTRKSGRTVKAAAIQTLRYLQDKYEGAQILIWHRFVDIDVDLPPETAFSMFILDILGVKGKGTAVSGYISDGTIKQGKRLVLEKADGRDIETVCDEVISPYTSQIERGSLVHVFIKDVTMGEVSQGDVLRSAA
jgi:translation elongation factor EF-Tu-like GTPase